jgi:hypothetical protein
MALSTYRPVTILAKDAETGKPIAGAEVRLVDPYTNPSQPAAVSSAITGPDGIVHLRAGPNGVYDLSMTGSANHYLPEEQTVPVTTVTAIEPAHWFEQVNKRPVQYVLALYADPPPSVELVVPDHYRGVVKAEIQVQEDLPNPPGKRCFSYPVATSGVVQVIGPTFLRRLSSLDVSIKDASGVPFIRNGVNADVGFWFVQKQGNTMVFFVGTLKEYIAQFPEVVVKVNPLHKDGKRTSEEGQGGGRGRRNRAGSDTPDYP